MSTIAAIKPYDPVFDGQKHYRTLLQCTARPGTIGQLDDVVMAVPPQLNRATVFIALGLFSADSSFCMSPDDDLAAEFLQKETAAKPVAEDTADFVIVKDAGVLNGVRHARQGTLPYPDTGATVIVQVGALSPAPIPGGLRLTLTGPGIETEAVAVVQGAPEALFDLLQLRNTEFPLGIDTFLTCDSLSAGPCVMALPRTTRVRWERI
jgi:alpha-D-ribose 1-methylphosphonate 5-triphosphate synthase subunit PhnH